MNKTGFGRDVLLACTAWLATAFWAYGALSDPTVMVLVVLFGVIALIATARAIMYRPHYSDRQNLGISRFAIVFGMLYIVIPVFFLTEVGPGTTRTTMSAAAAFGVVMLLFGITRAQTYRKRLEADRRPNVFTAAVASLVPLQLVHQADAAKSSVHAIRTGGLADTGRLVDGREPFLNERNRLLPPPEYRPGGDISKRRRGSHPNL